MARKVRIQYPGAIYHVMNRGDGREAIFEDDQDRERFLETLTEACEKTGWQILGLQLEQLSAISGGTGSTTGLAAGGPMAGRVGNT
jgi:hypothetical protein